MKRTAVLLLSILCGSMLCACIPTEKYFRGGAATSAPITSPTGATTPGGYTPGENNSTATPQSTPPQTADSPSTSESPPPSPTGEGE